MRSHFCARLHWTGRRLPAKLVEEYKLDEVLTFVCFPVAFRSKEGATIGGVVEETVINVIYRIDWDVLVLDLWPPDLWWGFNKEQLSRKQARNGCPKYFPPNPYTSMTVPLSEALFLLNLTLQIAFAAVVFYNVISNG